MNSYLLNRALGSVSPYDFHVAQTTRLVQLLEPAPGIRFSCRRGSAAADEDDDEIFAHKAGANVLAIDQYEGR